MRRFNFTSGADLLLNALTFLAQLFVLNINKCTCKSKVIDTQAVKKDVQSLFFFFLLERSDLNRSKISVTKIII